MTILPRLVPVSLMLLAACTAGTPAPETPSAPGIVGVRALPLTRKGPSASLVKLESLRKATPADLIAALGEPARVRWESQTQLYQYASASCVIDFWFREPTPGSPFRLIHTESRTRPSAANMDDQVCLDQVAALKLRAVTPPSQ